MNKYFYQINKLSNLTYILILVSPNLILKNDWIHIILVFTIYLFIFSISSIRVFYILTFPFLLISLTQLFYYAYIDKSLVNPLIIQITLFQSNWMERMSIINHHLFLLFFCFLMIIFFWRFVKKNIILKKYNFIFLIIIGVTFLSKIYTTKQSPAYKRIHIDNKYHFKRIALTNVKQIFPLNFLRNIWTAYLTEKKANSYFKNTKNFSFGYPKLKNSGDEIIILVIGESSRASSFGLNTPNIATNPRLLKRENLTSFKNAFTPYSSTVRSVPFSLSRTSIDDWKKKIYKEKSIVKAMKELGYKTFCIDNQEPNQGLLSYYKQESDIYIPTKKAMSYDENILPILDSVLKTNKSPKKFFLIHTYGSHYNYTHRYPKSMAKFTPDQSKKMGIKFKKELNNAYLNTIYYVDFFLDEIIKKVESKKSTVFYYSDHGENIYDDKKELILHAYPKPNKHTLNIPIIVWFSNAKKEDNPNILNIANLNKNKNISTESIFASILNLTKLDSSYYQINKSIFSKNLKSIDTIKYLDQNNIPQNLN